MDTSLTLNFSPANAPAPVAAAAVPSVAIQFDARLPGSGTAGTAGAGAGADLSAQFVIQFAPPTASTPAGTTGGSSDGGFDSIPSGSDPKSDAEKAAASTCEKLVDRIEWRPTPTEYPEWRVDQVEYESAGCSLSGDLPVLMCEFDQAANTITTVPADAFLTVMWPEDLTPFMSPWQGYKVAAKYQPALDQNKRVPTVDVEVHLGGAVYPGTLYEDGTYSVAVPGAVLAAARDRFVEVRLTQGATVVDRLTRPYEVDITPPGTPSCSVPSAWTTNLRPTVTVLSEPGVIAVLVGGSAVAHATVIGGGLIAITLPAQSASRHTITITATTTDAAGNVSDPSFPIWVTIDPDAPNDY